VRRVDADSVLGKAEERALLGVFEGDGLETAEDDGVCGWLDNVLKDV
jgi:hypothetical protein